MKSFKAGDLVYFPIASRKVEKLEWSGYQTYPFSIGGISKTFDKFGRIWGDHKVPSIFHATEENRLKLSELYGVDFEPLPKQPTSREIIEAVIKRDGSCWCGVSIESHLKAKENSLSIIRKVASYSESDMLFYDIDENAWAYAIPIDTATMTEITELPTEAKAV